jgi:hypothetical protein
MMYFCGNRSDLYPAFEEVWRRQDESRQPRSLFISSTAGENCSVNTPDPGSEELFRLILKERSVRFREVRELTVII